MFSVLKRSLALFTISLVIFAACGSDGGGGVVDPGHDTSQAHWWDNYLSDTGTPLTLPSGFKLVSLDEGDRTATRITSQSKGLSLNFRVDADWRSNNGWLFRGGDQGSTNYESLAGAVEYIKQGGWLTTGETFDWEGVAEDPPGSFEFVRVNRFTQFPIRSVFNGFATDLMTTLLSRPYIAYPTDTTKTWQGPPTNVSQGTGTEFQEIISYHITYLGTRSLYENTSKIGTWDDVILIRGVANQGQGMVEAYLAPDVGIVYYYLLTAFGQKAAGALVGYDLENRSVSGSTIKDYFPTAGGNHWIYEFSPDEQVDNFRFKVDE
jgi:hypothetical protein